MPLTLTKRRNQGQIYKDQEFSNMDLSSMLSFGSAWANCTFNNCDLSLSDFANNTIKNCRFVNCDLRLSNFRGSIISNVTFKGCNLRQAVLAGVHPLEAVGFFDCQMHYSSLFDSTVKGAHFISCNLHGADLRPIENTGWLFEDCVLWNASFNLGCTFLRGVFDERSVNLFVAMAARVHPKEESATILKKLAGKEMALVDRLMGEVEVPA